MNKTTTPAVELYGKTLLDQMQEETQKRDALLARIATMKEELCAKQAEIARLKGKAVIAKACTLCRHPADLKAEYSKLTDPKAREAFRRTHGRALGLN